MAITLDELLGRNTTEQSIDNFPSYEEFSSARNVNGYSSNRNDNYVPTQNFGYTQRDYAASVQSLPSYDEDVYGGEFSRPRQQSFYDYVARSNSSINDAELYERLSRTHENMRPVFDRSNAATAERKGLFTHSAQVTGAQQKVRGRLNTKGKIILGSFLAVVVTVMSLIIAFAGKINSGTAVVPASNAAASTAIVSQTL